MVKIEITDSEGKVTVLTGDRAIRMRNDEGWG